MPLIQSQNGLTCPRKWERKCFRKSKETVNLYETRISLYSNFPFVRAAARRAWSWMFRVLILLCLSMAFQPQAKWLCRDRLCVLPFDVVDSGTLVPHLDFICNFIISFGCFPCLGSAHFSNSHRRMNGRTDDITWLKCVIPSRLFPNIFSILDSRKWLFCFSLFRLHTNTHTRRDLFPISYALPLSNTATWCQLFVCRASVWVSALIQFNSKRFPTMHADCLVVDVCNMLHWAAVLCEFWLWMRVCNEERQHLETYGNRKNRTKQTNKWTSFA